MRQFTASLLGSLVSWSWRMRSPSTSSTRCANSRLGSQIPCGALHRAYGVSQSAWIHPEGSMWHLHAVEMRCAMLKKRRDRQLRGGGVDAVRRRLYQPIRADQLPDFALPLLAVGRGGCAVFETDASRAESALTTNVSECRTRVWVAPRSSWALWHGRVLLSHLRHGQFSWQLLSHKVLRHLFFAPFWASLKMRCLGVGPVACCHCSALPKWASVVAFFRFLRGEERVL